MLLFMDNFSIHVRPLSRQFPHATPVRNIGYIHHKTVWVRHPFATFNFSFILQGEGTYRLGGKTWPVKAPCVITQWPSRYVEYGPHDFWEELYLIYDSAHLKAFEDCRFADLDRPVWYLREIGPTRQKIAELREAVKALHTFGRADEIDRICEAMVLESLIGAMRTAPDANQLLIETIRVYALEHLAEPIDFEALARRHHLSPATFRRHWARYVGRPPGHYLTHLRIQQACRMLVETSLPIGTIAAAVGFEDPLYFSRKFHQATGQTATTYRKHNRVPMPFDKAP